MPKRDMPLVEGYYYHVYNRVNHDKNLFYSYDNYVYYLDLFKKVDFSASGRMIAYCLMPNHYHYLIQILDAGLFTKKMVFFFNKYLKSLNAARKETGPYFTNRFKAKSIEDEHYLLGLCCYIHQNPVKAGLVQSLDEWPFSNYLEFVGKRHGDIWDNIFFQEFIGTHSNYLAYMNKQYNEEDFKPLVFVE
jgi:putative transposase